MKISYNWLKAYVPEIPAPQKLAEVFTFHVCEIESMDQVGDNTIFDLKVLPDRAHDLLSHYGVAKEIAGLLNIPFADPTQYYKVPEAQPTKLSIEIEDDRCRRYMGRIVRNVKVGPSPEWVVKYLESIGQRSINNIVDATNLVLFDIGQPTHAFDAKKIETESDGTQKITVRNIIHPVEGVTLLGTDAYLTLKNDELVITSGPRDGGSAVLAIAGVKGGRKAEVDTDTTDIVLEVANFEPITVRKTARRLGLLTDAAKRFENDVTPELAPFAMLELSSAIAQMCPEAIFEEVVDMYPAGNAFIFTAKTISFATADISKILGLAVSADDIEKIFKQYNHTYSRNGDDLTLTPPSNRPDLTIVPDVADEIGRVIGYDKIPSTLPDIAATVGGAAGFSPKLNDTSAKIMMARAHFLQSGFSEVMTYAFRKKGEIEVAYAAKDKSALRTNLKDGLKEAYDLNVKNAALLEMDEIKLFEIGTVFPKDGTEDEEIHVAWADKKGVQECTLEEGTKDHPAEMYIYPDPIEIKKFKNWSPYPFIVRDVALWVSEGTDPETVATTIRENAGDLVVAGPRLFDTFTKEGKTSVAFRTVFQSNDKTLTDAEIEPIMQKVTDSLKGKGWEVR
ncbi:MAG: phenylalanine--tRNA ligase subunit beta [Candidatus Pacebacteria bacterium]|nr:phenylalanine--tRNA ligase subunit beta [Candidatus Paceibacterota bacterium]